MTLTAALRDRDVAQLPGKRDEDWRWTDLRGLIRDLPASSPDHAGDLPAGPFGTLGEVEAAVVNGRLRGPAEALRLKAGERRAVRLRLVSASQGTAHGAELAVEVGEGASLLLLESHEGLADGYLANTDISIRLAPGARLERIVLAQEGAEAVAVCTAEVALSPQAHFAQTVIALGTRRQRIETRVAHPGAGGHVRMDGAYQVGGRRHFDLTSTVTHEGLDGTTDQLIKGVVDDQARGVFQGRITVSAGADRTDARMGHHALILSDRAEVDARPELLIFADDVACAHGNTIGALDDEALFYARQRGIPEAQARALLTEAFIGEVVDRIEDEAAREAARAWLAETRGVR